jgi:hypothetical protein
MEPLKEMLSPVFYTKLAETFNAVESAHKKSRQAELNQPTDCPSLIFNSDPRRQDALKASDA